MPIIDKTAVKLPESWLKAMDEYCEREGVKLSHIAKKLSVGSAQMSQIRKGQRKINRFERAALIKLIPDLIKKIPDLHLSPESITGAENNTVAQSK